MAVRFSLKMFGDEQIQRDLLRMETSIKNARPMWEGVRDDLMNYYENLYDSQGAAGAGKWAPLADSTVRAKASAGLDPRILHATLALRKSLTVLGAKGSVKDISRDGSTLRFGTTIPYAEFHYTGTSRMPARNPVKINDLTKRAVTKRVQRWVMTGEVL